MRRAPGQCRRSKLRKGYPELRELPGKISDRQVQCRRLQRQKVAQRKTPHWLTSNQAPKPVDGITACRMFNHAFSGADLPGNLSTDNDPLLKSHRWQANLRILEVNKIKSIPYAPMPHPFIERIIGTIRREYLDDVPFWNSLDLARKLDEFKDYYNNHRTHAAHLGQSPAKCDQQSKQIVADISDFGWQTHCKGLFQTPVPA